MKGSKMSAILAIVLMLSGAIAFIPFAHAQGTMTGFYGNIPLPFQATQTQANANLPYPPNTSLTFVNGINGTTGTTFWADCDAYNVANLSTWQIGFDFNPTLFNVLTVTNGSILNGVPASHYLSVSGSIDNVGGEVMAYAWSATDSYTFNGAGAHGAVDLMNVEFQIVGTAPYISTILGTPQALMTFSTTKLTTQLIFLDNEGNTLTPTFANDTAVYMPHVGPKAPPTASFTITPNPTTVGTMQTFDASASGPGFNGTINVPITSYVWNFGDATTLTSATPVTTHLYAAAGSYTVTLTVVADGTATTSDHYNQTATATETATVYPKAAGCVLTCYTQNWRYVDPYYINTGFVGSIIPGSNNTVADSFRPGDLVQLFANATYNGAPVQGGLVTFQVWDNKGNTVLTATAITNCYGQAEWEFRIPWPSTEVTQVNNFTQGSFGPTENTSQFGMWKAVATWQIGSQLSEQPPFEKTQATGILFDVSWGLTISILSVEPNPAKRGPASCGYGDTVVIKVNVANEYLESVPGLITGTIYDNLLVPIYPVASLYVADFPAGTVVNGTVVVPTVTTETLPGILIPSYAYVGIGYAVVNMLTTWPTNFGTAYCPMAWTTLSIEAP